MDGMVGYCPEWYYVLRAADRLHCTPWELLDQSIYWLDVGLNAIAAENRGADIRQQRGR
jgi:hypothetical protein